MIPLPFRDLTAAPDGLVEELAEQLWPGDWREISSLVGAVEASVRRSGAEPGPRLHEDTRTCLECLVSRGIVEQRGEWCRGVGAGLEVLRERIAAEHCRILLRAVHSLSPGSGRRPLRS